MLLDATRQVAGHAPASHQVDGARRAATLNIGGSTATTVSFVVDAAGAARMKTQIHHDFALGAARRTTTTRTAPVPGDPSTSSTTPGTSRSRARSPTDLDGVYLRNTENPLLPAISLYHPFDGDGMLHSISFADGEARYPNRFVRTEAFLAEREAGESLWAGMAEDPATSLREDGWGARPRMKDASSTDVVVHRGEALTSFWMCGDLYRLDPVTLEPLGGRRSAGGSRPRACRRTRRSTSAPASCSSSTTAWRRRTCTTASSAPTGELQHYIDVPAARAAPAPRHGVHRALRDPQRLPDVLGPGR